MSTDTRNLFRAGTPDQFLTASQAARLLSVHVSTVRRWIAQGKLPAYRVGDKGVRVKQADLALVATPMRTQDKKGGVGEAADLGIRPLTREEQQRGLQALEELRRMRAADLERRGGKLYPDSTELIRQMRRERTRELMRGIEE
jgi:excisionase family DNA binding protein